MHPEDQEKMAFLTPRGTYCYKVMPFGLKNVRATYQRLVTTMFKGQLDRTMVVYIDDMVVKSKEKHVHLADLTATVDILRKYIMKLNALKCVFGIGSGTFLGYIVNYRRIEANPKQITVILELGFPQSVKEGKAFLWTLECQTTLDGLKAYLLSISLLITPSPSDTRILYLAVSDRAISAVLLKEELGEQRPIFYVILHSGESSGRVSKWALELGQYDIQFSPRTDIKEQVLADFIAEFTGRHADLKLEQPAFQPQQEWRMCVGDIWQMYCDGSFNQRGCGAGVVIMTHEGALQVFCDSKLVINQLKGKYTAENDRITTYMKTTNSLLMKFDHHELHQITRDQNTHADAFACLASVINLKVKRTIEMGFVNKPSIGLPNFVCINVIDLGLSWMDPITVFLSSQ
ncbi:uncharacterized protein LOC114281391 [Camellia sinensis]|uniref:uncharacterized protein LOC114281391 n=1 Tax=Camellia sinensis TaxID=4442 RepID=UPI001035AD07|nr:uncharacterized protein LOC114281391 [Camellia sinensis]